MSDSGRQEKLYTDCEQCFKFIVNEPPRPLTEEDIWFQIGHVHEQQKDVSYFPSPRNLFLWLTFRVV